MIKYAAYLPVALLGELSVLMDFHFLEPNEDPRYMDFYKRRTDKEKLLDNGLVEFKDTSWSVEKLVPYAERVGADIVVAPDQLGNWQFNLDNLKVLRKQFTRCALVLAGPNWQHQAEVADGYKGCTMVCLPYRLNRIPVEYHRVHLLGFRLPEHYTPFRAVCENLSLDTVEPISAAYNGWSYEKSGFASFPRPADYNDLTMASHRLELARDNIVWFKNYLNTKA